MSVELPTGHHLVFLSSKLKRGLTSSSESTLVKMSHRLKSHVVAQLKRHFGTYWLCEQ